MLTKIGKAILVIGGVIAFIVLAPLFFALFGLLLMGITGFGIFCLVVFLIWALTQD